MSITMNTHQYLKFDLFLQSQDWVFQEITTYLSRTDILLLGSLNTVTFQCLHSLTLQYTFWRPLLYDRAYRCAIRCPSFFQDWSQETIQSLWLINNWNKGLCCFKWLAVPSSIYNHSNRKRVQRLEKYGYKGKKKFRSESSHFDKKFFTHQNKLYKLSKMSFCSLTELASSSLVTSSECSYNKVQFSRTSPVFLHSVLILFHHYKVEKDVEQVEYISLTHPVLTNTSFHFVTWSPSFCYRPIVDFKQCQEKLYDEKILKTDKTHPKNDFLKKYVTLPREQKNSYNNKSNMDSDQLTFMLTNNSINNKHYVPIKLLDSPLCSNFSFTTLLPMSSKKYVYPTSTDYLCLKSSRKESVSENMINEQYPRCIKNNPINYCSIQYSAVVWVPYPYSATIGISSLISMSTCFIDIYYYKKDKKNQRLSCSLTNLKQQPFGINQAKVSFFQNYVIIVMINEINPVFSWIILPFQSTLNTSLCMYMSPESWNQSSLTALTIYENVVVTGTNDFRILVSKLACDSTGLPTIYYLIGIIRIQESSSLLSICRHQLHYYNNTSTSCSITLNDQLSNINSMYSTIYAKLAVVYKSLDYIDLFLLIINSKTLIVDGCKRFQLNCPVSSLTFGGPSENYLITGGEDSNITIWDVRYTYMPLLCINYLSVLSVKKIMADHRYIMAIFETGHLCILDFGGSP